MQQRRTVTQIAAVMGDNDQIHRPHLVDRTDELLLHVPGQIAEGCDARRTECHDQAYRTRILLPAILVHRLHAAAPVTSLTSTRQSVTDRDTITADHRESQRSDVERVTWLERAVLVTVDSLEIL